MTAEEENIWYFENVSLYNVLCPHKVKVMDDTHDVNSFNKGELLFLIAVCNSGN